MASEKVNEAVAHGFFCSFRPYSSWAEKSPESEEKVLILQYCGIRFLV
jgi:hypothetical protein